MVTDDHVEPVDRAGQLAGELARVRQRGIDYLDRSHSRQRRVEIPLLDAVASEAGFDIDHARPSQISAYLDKELIAYAETRPSEAAFIQQLLYDEAGRSPGPAGAAGLLRLARKSHQISDETFRKLQRQHLVEFAEFLLATEPDQPGVSWWSITLPVLLILATCVLALVLLSAAML